MLRKQPELAEYMALVPNIQALDPKNQKLVTRFIEAHRRVDFYVDMIAFLEAPAFLEPASQKAQANAALIRIHSRAEERWADYCLTRQERLTQREANHAIRQLFEESYLWMLKHRYE